MDDTHFSTCCGRSEEEPTLRRGLVEDGQRMATCAGLSVTFAIDRLECPLEVYSGDVDLREIRLRIVDELTDGDASPRTRVS